MKRKLSKEISQPFMIIGLIVMLAMSAVIIWFHKYIGAGAFVLTAAVYLFHMRYTTDYVERTLEKNEKTVFKEREGYMEAVSYGAPLLICVVSRNGEIIWSNQAFDKVFEDAELKGRFINSRTVEPFFSAADTQIKTEVGGRHFVVTGTDADFRGHERRMLFWNDSSEKEALQELFNMTRPCAAYINVDNYDEMLEASPAEEQSGIAAQIDRTIHNWAISMEAVLIRARSDRYLMIFESRYLPQLKETRFPILNQMHDIETNADFPPSLSIGVCTDDDSLEDLQNGAQAALDLALGRGGDQAVVRGANGDTEYYGGALPAVEKRNKGKSRVMAHIFAQLIDTADNVLILGHARPDMDCFGAALGVYALVNNMGKPVSIILEEPGDGIELIYAAAKAQDSYKFINHEEAMAALGPETLVVMVDHHRAAISEFPQLIRAADKIALIDHHRRSGDAVDKAVLSYMETYASSASELVSELLQYSGERGVISRFEAEALLSGIALDTKSFTVNAGVRTFEAASWLRRSGADMANIKSFFKVGLDFYQKKSRIVSSAEVLPNGVAVAYTREDDPSMQVLVAQVADELLDMKGVEASIVAGREGRQTLVSARSAGKINVQTLMEKLGGGGHQTGAAAQVQEGPEEAIAKAVAIMREEHQL
ncbi:MAG: DHH family phosphoesterase [Firmicutes bacterium]|nr:DHH family phosphoesterase [Bacillota bacterium]